jgi:hypothetical protein
MPEKSKDSHDPQGFTPRSGRAASEHAREQGWQINEDERTKTSTEKQPYDGGIDYDVGAQDLGDTLVDISSAKPPRQAGKPKINADQKIQKKKTA